MNSKGFTLIELITTFALSSVIIILLINIVLIMKENYVKIDLKSKLILEQNNLNYMINSKFSMDNLGSYYKCVDSNFCYQFNFVDGTTSKLIVTDNYISFNNYKYELDYETIIEETNFELIKIETKSDEVNNSFLVIEIVIKNKLFKDEDFGINFIYQYNSKKITL